MVVIVMGVTGAGKTTVGTMLARMLGWEFHDADQLHPRANVEKMSRGIALTDQDRAPWLAAVRALIEECLAGGRDAVVACSALKESYRELIVADPARVKIVYLKIDPATVAKRLQERTGHFMNPALMQSQFDTLEEPRDAIIVDATEPPPKVVASIRAALSR
ncbi:MAG TPA: gluconokinase [Candidatus Binataceae bacterium]